MLGVVAYAIAVERIHRLTTHSAQSHRHDAVFDMDDSHPAGLEHSEEVWREEIHLLEKLLVAFRVAEVGVIGRVFVLGCKRNRGYNKPH